jgi:hypothetical protein
MKTNLRISHSIHPDGTVLYPCKDSKEEKSNTKITTLAVLIIMLTYVVVIGALLFNYLIYNFFIF